MTKYRWFKDAEGRWFVRTAKAFDGICRKYRDGFEVVCRISTQKRNMLESLGCEVFLRWHSQRESNYGNIKESRVYFAQALFEAVDKVLHFQRFPVFSPEFIENMRVKGHELGKTYGQGKSVQPLPKEMKEKLFGGL